MKGKYMQKVNEDNVYEHLNSNQRAHIDEINTSTARWGMVKWYVVGGIVLFLGALAFAS